MNTKTISQRALSVIDQYMHFKAGAAVCSVPYFNNRTTKSRAGLRAYIGKGSPQDIFDEVQALSAKYHIDIAALADESLKKLLSDSNIGIECSGFAYYVLNAESEERGAGSIDKHISFVNCTGLLGKMRCSLRPAENCDVSTLAHEKNSSIVPTYELAPGDVITMTDDAEESERDHILVIHQIEYQNFIPMKIHYSHAVAYPEDGVYGTGVRQGTIEVVDAHKPITDASCRWIEDGRQGDANRLHARALKSKTETRRMKWLSPQK